MTERIQKILAQQGIASRRQIEQWIREGRITVNGQLASLGTKATLTDQFCIDDQAIVIHPPDEKIQILLYYKPIGEVCTRHDPEGRETVFSALPKLERGRWVVVGRLDYHTSGLLLFSNNGDVAQRLAHPKYGFEREYKVRVYGEVTAEIISRLSHGVILDDGPAAFKRIVPENTTGRNQWFTVTLAEGRNRIVRRLWASQGLTVNRLERIRFGPIRLPADLQLGEYYFLSEREQQLLLSDEV